MLNLKSWYTCSLLIDSSENVSRDPEIQIQMFFLQIGNKLFVTLSTIKFESHKIDIFQKKRFQTIFCVCVYIYVLSFYMAYINSACKSSLKEACIIHFLYTQYPSQHFLDENFATSLEVFIFQYIHMKYSNQHILKYSCII